MSRRMLKWTRRNREKPLEEGDQNTENSKDDDGKDGRESTWAGQYPDNGAYSNEEEYDARNEPARPGRPLALVRMWEVGVLLLLLCCHAPILCQAPFSQPLL